MLVDLDQDSVKKPAAEKPPPPTFIQRVKLDFLKGKETRGDIPLLDVSEEVVPFCNELAELLMIPVDIMGLAEQPFKETLSRFLEIVTEKDKEKLKKLLRYEFALGLVREWAFRVKHLELPIQPSLKPLPNQTSL